MALQRPTTTGIHVVGVDPGFAHMGVAVMELPSRRVVEVSVIETIKSEKKHATLVADDDCRRTRELFRALRSIIAQWHPKVICAEAKTPPRHATASAQLSLGVATVVCAAEERGLALLQAPPKLLKGAAGLAKPPALPPHLRPKALAPLQKTEPAKYMELKREADRFRAQRRAGSKADVRAAMLAAYGDRSPALVEFGSRGTSESQSHGFDAVAAIHACLEGDIIRAIISMAA